MTKKNLLHLEIGGAIAIILIGSLFHFCYEWSDEASIAGIFCAVNESVWEHMKIGFWPALFYGIFLWIYMENPPTNFLFAQTLSLYVLSITIPILFYSYTAVLGTHMLLIDILIFIIAIVLGRLTSYWIITREVREPWSGMTVLLLLVILFAYSTFTFYPPKLPLFKDPSSGGYGIELSSKSIFYKVCLLSLDKYRCSA